MSLNTRIRSRAHLITTLPHGASSDAVDVVSRLFAVLGDQLGELDGKSPLRHPLGENLINLVEVHVSAISLEKGC